MKLGWVVRGKIPAEWPPITVLLLTYNRPEILRRTLRGYQKHLKYPGQLLWRLADDGSPKGYLDGLAADFPELDLKWTVTPRKGLGANANTGLKACETKYIFFSEDDWEAKSEIDLEFGLLVLENVPQVAVVRYDIAPTNMFLRGHELKVNGGFVRFFVVEPHSKFWYMGGHPHLKHLGFHESYGYFPEGVSAFNVEKEFTYRARDINGPLVVVLGGYCGRLPYKHIGFPRIKGTSDDVGWAGEVVDRAAADRGV